MREEASCKPLHAAVCWACIKSSSPYVTVISRMRGLRLAPVRESRYRHAQCGSRDLNQGPDGGNAGPQTSRHADCPLAANGSYLKGAILGHGYDERDHSRLGKMDAIDGLTALF